MVLSLALFLKEREIQIRKKIWIVNLGKFMYVPVIILRWLRSFRPWLCFFDIVSHGLSSPFFFFAQVKIIHGHIALLPLGINNNSPALLITFFFAKRGKEKYLIGVILDPVLAVFKFWFHEIFLVKQKILLQSCAISRNVCFNNSNKLSYLLFL